MFFSIVNSGIPIEPAAIANSSKTTRDFRLRRDRNSAPRRSQQNPPGSMRGLDLRTSALPLAAAPHWTALTHNRSHRGRDPSERSFVPLLCQCDRSG